MTRAAEPILDSDRPPLFSWVWLVPIAALIVALGVAWQNYSDRGPLISVTFPEASGIIKGETKLKFRDVEVGYVEELRFTAGLQSVRADIRVDQDIAPYIGSESQFWIVRPQIGPQGVSGLDTVLSGVYIAGFWDTEATGPVTEFAGLARAPVSGAGREGLRVVLRAKDGTKITDGTPVLHKGIEVGQLNNPRLDTRGEFVLVDAFIRAPHDQLITSATRFWDASGFSFSLGAGGAKLDVESLAALVGGGISFDTIVSGGRKPSDGMIFDLFKSEEDVRNSIFNSPGGRAQSFGILFEGTVAGLSVGAPVEFRGVRIGEVASLSAEFTDQDTDISEVQLVVVIAINPTALGLDPKASDDEVQDFMAQSVAAGLRARLTTANILTGGLKVELAELDADPPARIITGQLPYPILPSVAADISDVSASAEGVFTRINNLPVEELMSAAITLLNSMNSIANDPNIADIPKQAAGLIADTRRIVASDQIAGLPEEIGTVLARLKRASGDLETLVARVSDDAVADDLIAAIAAARTASTNLRDASMGLPALATQIEALAAKAAELPMEDLVASSSALVSTIDAFAKSEAMTELPPALTAALAEIRALTARINQGTLVAHAEDTLGAAKRAADQIAASSERLPELISQLNRAATTARTTLEGFDTNSRIPQNTLSALREIQRAAEAVSSLARAIERRPSSLLTGR